MEGGNGKNATMHSVKIKSTYRITHHSSTKNRNTNTTRKIKPQKMSDMTPREHFLARMNLPIGTTSFGIALTPEMIENNARIEKQIDEDIKNGYYNKWGLPKK